MSSHPGDARSEGGTPAAGGGDILTADFRSEPYWWEAARPAAVAAAPLPPRADVVLVGSGCTALSAALTLARAGRAPLILEAGLPGQGASSRATGVIGRTLKHGFSEILATHGEAVAKRYYGEARAAFEHVLALIESERIDCDLIGNGRYMAANSPAHYEAMARDLEAKRKHLGDPYEMVPRAEQHREIGSDLYHGGGVVPDQYLLHPAKYTRGLLQRALDAGATLAAGTPATGIRREGDGLEVATPSGRIAARHVVVATNGYSGLPWFRRRVVPIDAFTVATEPLPEAMLRELLPQGRCFHDYRIDSDYGRPAVDQPRLLFGGLTGRRPGELRERARQLHRRMLRIFPQLAGSRLSHVWTGRCAGAFDLYPHIGVADGVHYAMGYCFGSGLPLGSLLGHKLALRILGRPGGDSVFDGAPLTTRFFHWGPPWFMPLVMAWYNRADRRGF
jgi:glycine/D-amino acid oxidase-like deaminating enzyme